MVGYLRKLLRFFVNESSVSIKDSDLEYLLWLSNLYLLIKNVPGHIAEIGVASGRNAILFGKLISLHGDSTIRRYYGFDTFSGYTERDLATDTHLSSCAFTDVHIADVIRRIEFNDLTSLCHLVQGDVLDTVPHFLNEYSDERLNRGLSKFSLLYIDCNAYQPAIKSMESFLPHLMPGSIIAVDEKRQGSETKALIDFASSNGFEVRYPGALNVPILLQIPLASSI